jgi:RNA polymerase sigma-70 factor, ECF subfamily
MTQLTVLPLATDEPRADVSLIPEARSAPRAVDASGISPDPDEPSWDNEPDTLPSAPERHSAMYGRRDSSSAPRLVAAQVHANQAANARLVAIVHEQSRNVWRALKRLGVPIDLLDDATQEVFIIVSRKLHVIDEGAERSFVYGTAVRVAANLRRSRQARSFDALSETDISLWQKDPDTEQLVHRKHLRELLDQILDNMPDDLREVFVLFELEKLTRNELAELLFLPAGTVASRLRRARELFEGACEKLRGFPEGGPR